MIRLRGVSWIAIIGLLAACASPTRAQSGGSFFVPTQSNVSSVVGRSTERDRTPGAWEITDQQWEKFREFAIADGRPHAVVVRLNSLRARQFKEDLTELLQTIPGWTVEDQGIYTAGTLPSFKGILVQNRSEIDPSPEARFLKAAFDAAGILPEAHFDPTQPRLVRIVIGAPPGD